MELSIPLLISKKKCEQYISLFFSTILNPNFFKIYFKGPRCPIIIKILQFLSLSHISNITIDNAEFKLKKNQVVIDNYSNTNLISFLLELGIVKRIITRIDVQFVKYPVVELDLDILDEYCYKEEELMNAS